jgi:precorrin isomerase
LLSIFDQKQISDNAHLLYIDDENFPEAFRPIIRRLIAASQDSQIVANMEFEDNFNMSIQEIEAEKDYIIMQKEKAIEQERAEKEQERAEKEQALAETEKERVEKEKERVEKEKERAEKEKALAEVAELKRLLAKQ